MPGIERRARALQRRRRVTTAATALSVLLAAVVLPVAVHRYAGDDADGAGSLAVQAGVADSLVPGSGHSRGAPDVGAASRAASEAASRGARAASDTAVESGAGTAAEAAGSGLSAAAAASPANVLGWPSRVPADRPADLVALIAGSRAHLAADLRIAPDRLFIRDLWAGRMPGTGEWVYAFQSWPAGGIEAEVTVYRAGRVGGDVTQAYRYAPYVRTATAAGSREMSRVPVVAVPVDQRWALVLVAPSVQRVGYAAEKAGGFVYQAVENGAALVARQAAPAKPGSSVELFQAVDARGAVLTEPDAVALRRAAVSGGRPLRGWGLDAQ